MSRSLADLSYRGFILKSPGFFSESAFRNLRILPWLKTTAGLQLPAPSMGSPSALNEATNSAVTTPPFIAASHSLEKSSGATPSILIKDPFVRQVAGQVGRVQNWVAEGPWSTQ